MKKDDKQEGQEQESRRRNRHSNSFRDQMIRALKEKGLSGRKAERGFRAMFQVIGRGVRRGDVVELPGLGILQAARWEKKHQRWVFRRHRNIHTGKSPYRIVRLQTDKRRIIFTPYRRLDLTPPPPPLSPAEIEARQLAAELLGGPVNDRDINRLQQDGVNIHPHKQGALLRRLRELKKRGKRFQSITYMSWALAELYWL